MDMKKTLIVVDMQNDFIDGALGTKEAQAIVGNVKKKIEEYHARGDEIIFTRDTHQEDYLETPEGKKLPVKHCIYGTKGWEIAEGLEVPDGIYIDKPTFGWVHWNEREFDEIELVGAGIEDLRIPDYRFPAHVHTNLMDVAGPLSGLAARLGQRLLPPAPQIKKSCIGCGICAKQCEFGAVTVENNIAHIDQSKCTGCGKCAEKCPKKIIMAH